MPQQTIQLAVRESDSRRITAVLATEYPVDRAYGTEILQIERSAINFERFPLPTITQHNMRNLPIGVAMNPRIINRELLHRLPGNSFWNLVIKDLFLRTQYQFDSQSQKKELEY